MFLFPVFFYVIMLYMLNILFENDDIIAVDKPAGLACIAERDREKDNLHAQLSAMYPHKIFIVHRLDKEASGVVIFAKNAAAHRCLCRQFAEHTVEKTYIALVHGSITNDNGKIDNPLRQFGSGRVAVDMERGKPSVTEYKVFERFRDFTLVHAYPITGRRHQLRVHFYSMGHAIAGDPLYGQRETSDESPPAIKCLMLHAEKIKFILPFGEQIIIKSPLPESFTQVLEALKKAYL
jgi:tRNA pseudouridine32 synthase/23S rRNA pseudouridine746 synthase